jgi:hypothetical protein
MWQMIYFVIWCQESQCQCNRVALFRRDTHHESLQALPPSRTGQFARHKFSFWNASSVLPKSGSRQKPSFTRNLMIILCSSSVGMNGQHLITSDRPLYRIPINQRSREAVRIRSQKWFVDFSARWWSTSHSQPVDCNVRMACWCLQRPHFVTSSDKRRHSTVLGVVDSVLIPSRVVDSRNSRSQWML